jgi:hypothetical protein
LYWCVNAIVKWKGKEDYRKDIIHIHGTKDEMFPYRNIKNAIPVKGGAHSMLLIQHEEVNRLLAESSTIKLSRFFRCFGKLVGINSCH